MSCLHDPRFDLSPGVGEHIGVGGTHTDKNSQRCAFLLSPSGGGLRYLGMFFSAEDQIQ